MNAIINGKKISIEALHGYIQKYNQMVEAVNNDSQIISWAIVGILNDLYQGNIKITNRKFASLANKYKVADIEGYFHPNAILFFSNFLDYDTTTFTLVTRNLKDFVENWDQVHHAYHLYAIAESQKNYVPSRQVSLAIAQLSANNSGLLTLASKLSAVCQWQTVDAVEQWFGYTVLMATPEMAANRLRIAITEHR